MARGDDIEERLIEFAVRVIRVSGSLPETAAGKHIRRQLLRSGTSPAANYGLARVAESDRDFIHKLRIVLKELNEVRIWLKIIVRSDLLPPERLVELIDENDQLCRIINASIHTTQRNPKQSEILTIDHSLLTIHY